MHESNGDLIPLTSRARTMARMQKECELCGSFVSFVDVRAGRVLGPHESCCCPRQTAGRRSAERASKSSPSCGARRGGRALALGEAWQRPMASWAMGDAPTPTRSALLSQKSTRFQTEPGGGSNISRRINRERRKSRAPSRGLQVVEGEHPNVSAVSQGQWLGSTMLRLPGTSP